MCIVSTKSPVYKGCMAKCTGRCTGHDALRTQKKRNMIRDSQMLKVCFVYCI